MSSRKESMKRLKRLEKATKGHESMKRFHVDDEDESSGGPVPLWIILAVAIAAVLTVGILLWIHYGSSPPEP